MMFKTIIILTAF